MTLGGVVPVFRLLDGFGVLCAVNVEFNDGLVFTVLGGFGVDFDALLVVLLAVVISVLFMEAIVVFLS